MKQLHFSCKKCRHNLFVDEKPGWVKKVLQPCPNCGKERDDWEGTFALIGYGNYKKFISSNED